MRAPCLDQHQLILSSAAAAGFTPTSRTRGPTRGPACPGLVCTGFGVGLYSRLVPIPADHAVVRVPIIGTPSPTRPMFTAVRRGSADQPAIARGLAAIREAARERP